MILDICLEQIRNAEPELERDRKYENLLTLMNRFGRL